MVTGSAQSSLARLVLFLVCLSIAGSLLAGTHYLFVDRPFREYMAHPPLNVDRRCDWEASYPNGIILATQKFASLFSGYYIVDCDKEKPICCYKWK